MASPATADTAARRSAVAPISRSWKGWCLIGACFALGYGITQRLVSIRLESGLAGSQRFEVKSFPGTELDSLRRRFGDASQQIRGDLDLLQLEREQKQESLTLEQRRAEMEQRERRQQDGATTGDSPAAEADPALEPLPLPEAPSLPPPVEPEPAAPVAPAPAPATPGTTP